jgi:catechol 2,3-dioxygenase-like lactoylglutathione lyase family enzyme
MMRSLFLVTVIVPDYDRAIAWYRDMLGFALATDQPFGEGKRFVVMRPDADAGAGLLLARAETDEERAVIGQQTPGRVSFFLSTDDFARDHALYISRGVDFIEAPRHEPYGTVAVFRDAFGNLWDFIQHAG